MKEGNLYSAFYQELENSLDFAEDIESAYEKNIVKRLKNQTDEMLSDRKASHLLRSSKHINSPYTSRVSQIVKEEIISVDQYTQQKSQ